MLTGPCPADLLLLPEGGDNQSRAKRALLILSPSFYGTSLASGGVKDADSAPIKIHGRVV